MEQDQKQPSNASPNEEVKAEYANNSFLEPSLWDLKIFFGQWYKEPGIDWHTAVTLPWQQAKLLSHYLRVNIALFEAQNGRILIPDSFRPIPPIPDPAGGADAALVERVQKMHQEFLETLG